MLPKLQICPIGEKFWNKVTTAALDNQLDNQHILIDEKEICLWYGNTAYFMHIKITKQSDSAHQQKQYEIPCWCIPC